MAERRMFAKSIIQSGKFLTMPRSTRLLYYDLGMNADDDGVVEAYTVMVTTKASEDDLRVLIAKGFVKVLNDDLVTYICDWNTNNFIRSDRYHQSPYKDLLLKLGEPESDKRYTNGIPMVDQRYTEVRLGKDRLDKVSLVKDRLGEYEGEDEVLYELLTKEGDIFPVYQSMIDHYSKLYPDIDVRQEFGAMQGWCEANDKNRKTFKGMKRFINGWLNRAKPKEKSFIEAAAELEKEGWEF